MPQFIGAIAGIIVILLLYFYYKIITTIMYHVIIKPFFKYSAKTPFFVHFIFFWIAFGFPYLFIVSYWNSKEQNKIFDNVINNTSDKTVNELLDYNFSVTNHPDSWSQLRGLWNVINHSPNVSSDLKRKVLAIFMSKGLYIGNTNIIDNYKK